MKDILVLLCVAVLIGGFVLFMRKQDIEREQRATELKYMHDALEALKNTQKSGGNTPSANDVQSAAELERIKLEREKLALEEKRRNEENARKAEQEAKENARKNKKADLKNKLSELENALSVLSDPKRQLENEETRRILTEIAKIDGILNDNVYKCYSYCIKFNDVVFKRVMKHDTDRPDNRGYYKVLDQRRPYYKHKDGTKVYINPNIYKDGKHIFWEKVDCAYVCEQHHLTWTEASAEDYKLNHYIEETTLNVKKSALRMELKKARLKIVEQRPGMIAAVRKEMDKIKAELAELETSEN